jgi:hypothetical protein
MKDMLPFLMMGNMGGQAGLGNMANMLPFMMMSKGGSNNDMFQTLMLSQMLGTTGLFGLTPNQPATREAASRE